MLTELQYQKMETILCSAHTSKIRGTPRADIRKTLNTILYVLYTGCRWKDVPKGPEYTPRTTAHRWLKRWQEEGVLQRALRYLVVEAGEKGKIEWERLIVDGTFSLSTRRRRGS